MTADRQRPIRRHVLAVTTVLALVGGASPAMRAVSVARAATNLTQYVDQFVGTDAGAPDYHTGGAAGNTFVGADVPFGMLQWGANTTPSTQDFAAGYSYPDSQIRAFSLTEPSGTGVTAEQDVPIMPTTMPVNIAPLVHTSSYTAYAMPFTHAQEQASPGYYKVQLGTSLPITAELTTSTRTGIGQFTFPATTAASMVIDPGGSPGGDGAATNIQISPGSSSVSGAAQTSQYTLYFYAQFDHPITAYGTWHDATVHQGSTADSGGNAGGYVTFDTTMNQVVTMRVGVSYVSVAGAQANLAAENQGVNFAAMRANADAAWNSLLNEVQVSGGSDTDTRMFYTMLYHSLLSPSVYSDSNGQYLGFDNTVHTATYTNGSGGTVSYTQYTGYSGWDIYRDQTALLGLLVPTRAADMAESLVKDAQQNNGFLPRFVSGNTPGDAMTSDDADAIIANFHAFGGANFETSAALSAMVYGATHFGTGQGGYYEREGEPTYQTYHYIAQDGPSATQTVNGPVVYGPAATTLEYTTDDFAIAQLAQSLGDTATYTTFSQQSQWWQNIYDPTTGYISPRMKSGVFVAGDNPRTNIVESDAVQYTWMVPYNPHALANAMGGNAQMGARLDSFFGGYNNARLNDGPTSQYAYMGNEPDLEAPWEYDFIGQPYKTQNTVRQIMRTIYSLSPGGYPGNDDLGTMSSWWVFSALGLYPMYPGVADFTMGSPLFPSTVLQLPAGTITINGANAGDGNPYVQSLTLNGVPSTEPWISLSSLLGSTLAFTLGSTPNTSWGSNPGDAPPSFATGEQPAVTSVPRAALPVAAGGSVSFQVGLTNVTDAAVTAVITPPALAGFTISPSSATLNLAAASSQSQTFIVQAPTGAATGLYYLPFTIQATPAGGSAVTLTPPVAEVAVAADLLLPSYNSVGITDDTYTYPDPNATSFDSVGYTFSRQALREAGLAPGQSVIVANTAFSWPDVPESAVDNVAAQGQTITLSTPQSGASLGFLGTATRGAAQGTVQITYTDGSTQSSPLGFSDWTLDGGQSSPLSGTSIVATMSYRNASTPIDTPGGIYPQQTGTAYVFYAGIPLTPGKSVARFTLPQPPGPSVMHIFAAAVSTGNPVPITQLMALNNGGISDDRDPARADLDGFGNSYSARSLRAAGLTPGQPLTLNGLTFNWTSRQPGELDNLIAGGQSITLPAPVSGSTLAFLGAATQGPLTGSVIVHYSDGSTQNVSLGLSDWTLNGGTNVSYGNVIVANMPVHNSLNVTTGEVTQTPQPTYLFEAGAPINAGKLVTQITLPSFSQGRYHVFAIAVGTPASGDLSALYNNTGISDDGAPTSANFDGLGYSYSAQALQSSGLAPGAMISYGGTAFQWPNVPAGQPDNVVARGQTIAFPAHPSGTILAFLGSAASGPSTGVGTVTYTDGSSKSFQLGFSDWTLGGGSLISDGNGIAARMTYRNSGSGPQSANTHVLYAGVPIDSGRDVASVTLPATVDQGTMHIFAVSVASPTPNPSAASLASFYNNTGASDDNDPTGRANANFDGVGYSYSAEALAAAAGIAPGATLVVGGTAFQWPNVAAGHPDNVLASGQTISFSPVLVGTKLAFLGAATRGPSTGTATITYSDGTTQTFALNFSDWTLGGGNTISYDNGVAAKMTYRNTSSGPQTVNTYVLYTEVALTAGKSVSSIQLPSTANQGNLHIYAMGTS